ncbi:hypothetical protein ACQ4PT_062915 [Festuca glaucescens]
MSHESRPLSVDEAQLRKMLKRRELGLASLERTIARQRARLVGLKEGGANAQFFRIYAAKRSKHNHIATLRDGDHLASMQGEVEEVAKDFFTDLLGTTRARDHDLDLSSLGLPHVDLAGLEAHFGEEEVWATIKTMTSNKSLGPDGFSWEFYKCCWAVITVDVLTALNAIFQGKDQFFDGLNTAFITLIPKKDLAAEMKDYRPISLLHSFSKLLALRLSPLMPQLIHKSQSAFIKGRCIQDNFILVRQAAISLHHRKLPALLLKIDVARAFDSVACPSLLSVLRQQGFGPRWIKWVLLLLRTATTRVLVNGSAGEAFRHARGLCQGDPLLPLLFVLAMDVLARMFEVAEQLGVLEILDAAGVKHRVSLYADDVIVFLGPTDAEVTVGDGTSVLFWEDQWIGGLNAAAIAPTILAMVRPRFRRRQTVAQGLLNHAWTADIADKLSVDATVQFFHLWDAISGVQPADATTDAFRWKWTADGCFSSRSAYRSMFQGFTALPGAANIWNA